MCKEIFSCKTTTSQLSGILNSRKSTKKHTYTPLAGLRNQKCFSGIFISKLSEFTWRETEPLVFSEFFFLTVFKIYQFCGIKGKSKQAFGVCVRVCVCMYRGTSRQVSLNHRNSLCYWLRGQIYRRPVYRVSLHSSSQCPFFCLCWTLEVQPSFLRYVLILIYLMICRFYCT